MEIRLKLKPIVFEKTMFGLYKTKEQLEDAMSYDSGGTVFGTHASGAKVTRDRKHVIAMNFSKFRHKSAIVEKKVRGRSKQAVKKREVVREAHWVGYRYLIPIDLLVAGNLKVVQHARHFDIVQL